MTISAYDRASEILRDLRQCILGRPPQDSSEQEFCKKMKELYDELDMICRKTHTAFFEYVHKGLGFELAEGKVIALNTRKNAQVMRREIDIAYECIEDQTYTRKEFKMNTENILISQAGEWLKSNRESLSSVTLQEQKTTSGHDIELPDNPTIKDITACINRHVSGKPYRTPTIWEYIYDMKNVKPKGKRGKAYIYDLDDAKNKIVPRLLKLPRVDK